MKVTGYTTICTVICFLFLGLAQVRGQDDSAARQKYLQAEYLYLQHKYAESLPLLNDAENMLGRKTRRIQWLKVLVYEQLAFTDISYLTPAMNEMKLYLGMAHNGVDSHAGNIRVVQEKMKELPGKAKNFETARIAQAELKKKEAWRQQGKVPRLGVSIGTGGTNWLGTDLGIVLGTRSGYWVIGSSTEAFRRLEGNDQFHAELLQQLKTLPYDEPLKKSLFHIGYFQGIRILPMEIDFIKPMLGARAIYTGNYRTSYHFPENFIEGLNLTNEGSLISNMINAGVDPSNYFDTSTSFKGGVDFDVVAGIMLHVKSITISGGKDLLNSKMTHFTLAFKIN